MVGGGEEERRQVMGSAGINWELRKYNRYCSVTVSCSKNTFLKLCVKKTIEAEGYLIIKVWVTQ